MRLAIVGRAQAATIYAQLARESDGLVWDGSGLDWVTRASNTAGTYRSLAWDTNSLQHEGTLDVSAAHPSPVPGAFTVLLYQQAGGSPSLANDLLIGGYSVTLQNGSDTTTPGAIGIQFGGAIDGSDLSLQAWLTVDGKTVNLNTTDPAATCDIEVIEQTSGVPLVDESLDTITADGHFETTVVDAVTEDNADKNYFARVTITVLGLAHAREFPLSTAG